MATKIEELEQKARDLQAAVDASQAREAQQDAFDKETIATLTAKRDELQAIIDAGQSVTDAQLQALIDALDTTITDINTPFPPA